MLIYIIEQRNNAQNGEHNDKYHLNNYEKKTRKTPSFICQNRKRGCCSGEFIIYFLFFFSNRTIGACIKCFEDSNVHSTRFRCPINVKNNRRQSEPSELELKLEELLYNNQILGVSEI